MIFFNISFNVEGESPTIHKDVLAVCHSSEEGNNPILAICKSFMQLVNFEVDRVAECYTGGRVRK